MCMFVCDCAWVCVYITYMCVCGWNKLVCTVYVGIFTSVHSVLIQCLQKMRAQAHACARTHTHTPLYHLRTANQCGYCHLLLTISCSSERSLITSEPVWPGGKAGISGKQRDLGSNLLWLSFLFKNCGLSTLSCDFIPYN